MKIRIKRVMYLTLTVAFIILSMKIAEASIIDDVMNLFGLYNLDKGSEESLNNNSNKITNQNFDEIQSEVAVAVEGIYVSIKDVDIESLKGKIDYDMNREEIKDVEQFLIDNGDAKKDLQYTFDSISYEIKDIIVLDNTAKVKIQYTLPSIKELYKKMLPKIILLNIGNHFNNGITSDAALSIIGSIKSELQKGLIKNEIYTYDFSFKKVDDNWLLTDVNDLISDATKYIEEEIVQ